MAVLSIAMLYLSGCAQDTIRTFALFDTSVSLVLHHSDIPGPLYYNMHDDENTSVEAARAVIHQHGGMLYELVHSGDRFIKFTLDSVEYGIDPNRIYSDAGVWRELRRALRADTFALEEYSEIADSFRLRDSMGLTNPAVWIDTLLVWDTLSLDTLPMRMITIPDSLGMTSDTMIVIDTALVTDTIVLRYVPDAQDSLVFIGVRAFADSLLSVMQIDSQRLVIALHNNKEDGYSLASYRIDSIYQDEALAIYVGLHPDPDDFFFVTERRIFEALQPNHYHIVLQDNEKMTDDGSLSVYCGIRGIQYVNVEAQHKHGKEQKKMLEVLLERIRE